MPDSQDDSRPRSSRAHPSSSHVLSGKAGQSFSIFTIGRHAFALETALVGELVSVEAVTPVPLARPSILGLFSLRGEPVALVDLAALLELQGGAGSARGVGKALVIKTQVVLAAFSIDTMEAVVPLGRGQFTPSGLDDRGELVSGMLTLNLKDKLTVTVLDSNALLGKLELLEYR